MAYFKNLYFILGIQYSKFIDIKWINYVESFVFKNVAIIVKNTMNNSKIKFDCQSIYVENMIHYYLSKQNYGRIEHKSVNFGSQTSTNIYKYQDQIFQNMDTHKIIVPFDYYFTRMCPTFPNFSPDINDIDIKLELNDLSKLTETKLSNDIASINLRMVSKTLLMDYLESKKIMSRDHEYLMPMMLSKTIELKNTTHIINFERKTDINHPMINSIFLYFTEGENILPYEEPCFMEIIVYLNDIHFFTMDRDLLKALETYEYSSQYHVKNVYAINISDRVHVNSTKSNAIDLTQFDIRIAIKLLDGYKSKKISVVLRGEHVLRIQRSNIVSYPDF